MTNLFALLVIYQIKHFLADYPLQGKYMLGKFQEYPKWILPLTAHAGVHFLFTFLIVGLFVQDIKIMLGLGLLDFVVHFVVDRIKASPSLGGRFKALTKDDFISHAHLVKLIEDQISHKHTLLSGVDMPGILNEAKLEWQKKEKSNKYFWWSLGLDQTAHHLTHYVIIWYILSYV